MPHNSENNTELPCTITPHNPERYSNGTRSLKEFVRQKAVSAADLRKKDNSANVVGICCWVLRGAGPDCLRAAVRENVRRSQAPTRPNSGGFRLGHRLRNPFGGKVNVSQHFKN